MNHYTTVRNLFRSQAFVFALLALVIVAPLLAPGYLISLQFPGSFEWDTGSYFYGLNGAPRGVFSAGLNTAFVAFFLDLLDPVIPLWVVQKIWIWLILWLSGIGAASLPFLRGLSRYYAGALYMVNPFTYVRLVAGDWGILTAYALLPFALRYFVNLHHRERPTDAVKVALLLSLMALFHLQFLLMTLVILGLVFAFLNLGSAERRMPHLKLVGMSVALFLLLNLYWVVPFFALNTTTSGLGSDELALLGPKTLDGRGPFVTMATLHGFWRDTYPLLQSLPLSRSLLYALLVFLALYGALSKIGDRVARPLLLAMVGSGGIGLLLALGQSYDISGLDAPWRLVLLPLGLWDAQIFLASLVLAYCYLGALGVRGIEERVRRLPKRMAQAGLGLLTLSLLVPVLYTLPMFQLSSQIDPVDFPEDWQTVRERLASEDDEFNVLVFPWHLYMPYSWLDNEDKTIASPAAFFFSQPVIVADRVETPPLYSEPQTEVGRYIEFLLDRRHDVTNFGELVAPLNVGYIILFHEADYQTYSFLGRQEDLEVELDLERVTLFKNNRFRANIYGVDGLIEVRNWTEFVELSRGQEVMEHIYPLGEPVRYIPGSGVENLELKSANRVKILIENPSSQWLVLTLPPGISREGWKLNGEGPTAMNLGLMPSFEASGEGKLTYRPFFRLYVPLYVVSVLALLFSLDFLYRRSGHRR